MRVHIPIKRKIREANWLLLSMILLATSLYSACGSNLTLNLEGRERTIVVPTHAVVQPEQRSDGSPQPRRYIVRMSDGQLDWEVELPEVATGYELRIPFKGKQGGGRAEMSYENTAPLTSGDRELLASMRRSNPGLEGEGSFDSEGRSLTEPGRAQQDEKSGTGGQASSSPRQERDAKPSTSRQSYLIGLEKARQLFKAGKYELAIIALKSLDEDYPNDVTIKSMLGTLWLQLNQPTLAREAWEAALKIDPNNRSVIQALKQLELSTSGTEE